MTQQSTTATSARPAYGAVKLPKDAGEVLGMMPWNNGAVVVCENGAFWYDGVSLTKIEPTYV